jgi:hypothetical protein
VLPGLKFHLANVGTGERPKLRRKPGRPRTNPSLGLHWHVQARHIRDAVCRNLPEEADMEVGSSIQGQKTKLLRRCYWPAS